MLFRMLFWCSTSHIMAGHDHHGTSPFRPRPMRQVVNRQRWLAARSSEKRQRESAKRARELMRLRQRDRKMEAVLSLSEPRASAGKAGRRREGRKSRKEAGWSLKMDYIFMICMAVIWKRDGDSAQHSSEVFVHRVKVKVQGFFVRRLRSATPECHPPLNVFELQFLLRKRWRST